MIVEFYATSVDHQPSDAAQKPQLRVRACCKLRQSLDEKMDSLRKVYHNSQTGDFKRTVREFKNKVYNYNEMEQLVREATCNDGREPQEMLLKEIAKGTFTVDFSCIMSIIWKRIKDKTTEHHPNKCLRLLEFLLREGNAEMVQAQINNNLHLIQALTNFRLISERGIDVGGRVRDNAARFLEMLEGSGGGGGEARQGQSANFGSDSGGGFGGDSGGGFGKNSFQDSFDSQGGFGTDPFANQGGFGSDGFSGGNSGANGDDAWKSQVQWDEGDGPAGGGGFGGGGRGGGGKFAIKIKDTSVQAAAPTPAVKLALGSAAPSSGRTRPTSGASANFGAMPSASKPPPSAEPSLFDVGPEPADPFASSVDPFATAPNPCAAVHA